MFTLLKKEVSAFLNSLIGYIVMIVFLLGLGLFLWVLPSDANILNFGYANLNGFFIIAPMVFLFLIPAITMRLFADEKRSGTIELLLTKPLSEFNIVMAKYLAAVVLIFISLLPTIIYYFSVYQLGLPKGNIDTGAYWGSFIGLLLLGASFAAIGVFASSITDNQVVSFILAVVLCGFFFLGFEFIHTFNFFGKSDLFVKSLGMNYHFASLSRGVIDTRDILYFISLISVFILLTKISLESRKW